MGFEATEIYLVAEDVRDTSAWKNTAKILAGAGAEVVSVHTPHVLPSQTDALFNTVRLGRELGVDVVLHSSRIVAAEMFLLAEAFKDIGYANIFCENPVTGLRALEYWTTAYNQEIVLDVAHLWLSSRSYKEDFSRLIKQARLVHLADACLDPLTDNMALGEGNIDMKWTIPTIEANFKGPVIVEVPQQMQGQGRLFIEGLLRSIENSKKL